MLSGEGLWVRYGHRGPWVLRDVDVDVRPGEVVGLWGASGRGKSTLATTLAGLRTPDRGTVQVDGRPFPTAPREGPRPVQLVLQHAERAMNPRWRIRDVLAEARRAGDGEVDPADPADPAHGLVDVVWLDRRPHELSGGELQRVNLARALLARPAYVLADEISSSLDALTQALLWQRLLGEVRERGLGVLAVTHDPALLDRVADRTVVLPDRAAVDGEDGLDDGDDGGRVPRARLRPAPESRPLLPPGPGHRRIANRFTIGSRSQ
ncbi:ABC transporter ATP-binding protein [Nocardioides solisilvae]|uniref:ABC transporter ATP-binding protein n=1 Tax=Nocardioides solisilvae TaxID=1542435 RepID=UPI000D746AB0|nr:ATP-binding cassette domain-containing protein [Nocardioides solisilvae]